LKCKGQDPKNTRQPHSTQIISVCRLLSADVPVTILLGGGRCCYEYIYIYIYWLRTTGTEYGSQLKQDGRLSDHLVQIKTGEGKSMALGFTAVMLALLGFSVDVVCYSRLLCTHRYVHIDVSIYLCILLSRLLFLLQSDTVCWDVFDRCCLLENCLVPIDTITRIHRYLCDRDRQNFDSLFQLLDQGAHVSYNDFSRLSSEIMDRGVPGWPNVRTSFKRYARP